jgi:RHS repeat-associated protein
VVTRTRLPAAESVPQVSTIFSTKPVTFAYYELDLAGNVRRLRGPAGEDWGGYRYSAFGRTVENTVQNVLPHPPSQVDLPEQPLRWKGMWRYDIAGTELYDARARMWSPALGTFLSVDEFAIHDPKGTLWSWPNQSPIRYRDPSGRLAGGETFILEAGTGSAVESGTATTAVAAGPFALFALAAAGIIVPATYDIMTQLDDFEHPTVYGGGGGSDPPPTSCPAPPTASEEKPGDAPAPEAASGGAGKRIGGGPPRTPHGQQRSDEAKGGDPIRQMGDVNRVIREGRAFSDAETGNDVYVSGNRVVIITPDGAIETQFNSTRRRIQDRIGTGRWLPKP